jgi:hypothetical protein
VTIDEFAQVLMREVRDPAVREADLIAALHAKGKIADRWRSARERPTADLIAAIIPDLVDLTIFQLLDAIDAQRLRLAVWDGDSECWVGLEVLGHAEMAGWVAGPRGWRDRYAVERHAEWVE